MLEEKEIPARLLELEQKAISIYIENSDWNGVVSVLPKEEQEEYWKLFNQTFGEVRNEKKEKDKLFRQELERKSDEEIMKGFDTCAFSERKFYMTELKKRGLR